MNRWQTKTLEFVCVFIKDGTHQTPTYSEDGYIFLSSKNVTTGVIDWDNVKYIPDELHEKLYKALSPTIDDILLAKNGTTGVAAIVDRNIIFDVYVSLAVLRPKKDIIYPRYLLWAVNSPQTKIQFNQSLKGIGVPNLHLSSISKTFIPVPPIEIQYKIVSILDKLQSIITHRKQQLEKLDELVKARFVEMFGDIKLNSKNFDTIQLDKIANVGSSRRVFVEELQESGIPFYRGTEIGALAEGENIVPELFITKEHYEVLKKATGVPDIGDLLMPSICSDGRIWLVNTKQPFYFKDGRVLWIHPISENIDSVYLLYFLKQKIEVDYNNIASGTTFAELKIFALKGLKIFMPSIDLQNQFADFVKKINKSKFLNENVTRLLRRVKLYDQF